MDQGLGVGTTPGVLNCEENSKWATAMELAKLPKFVGGLADSLQVLLIRVAALTVVVTNEAARSVVMLRFSFFI